MSISFAVYVMNEKRLVHFVLKVPYNMAHFKNNNNNVRLTQGEYITSISKINRGSKIIYFAHSRCKEKINVSHMSYLQLLALMRLKKPKREFMNPPLRIHLA